MVTTEALVAELTGAPGSPREAVLARPTRDGRWHAIGLTRPLGDPLRSELADRVPLLGTTATLPGIVTGLPGSADLTYRPAQPVVILEGETDGMGEYGRLRHRSRGVRIRADLDVAALPFAE